MRGAAATASNTGSWPPGPAVEPEVLWSEDAFCLAASSWLLESAAAGSGTCETCLRCVTCKKSSTAATEKITRAICPCRLIQNREWDSRNVRYSETPWPGCLDRRRTNSPEWQNTGQSPSSESSARCSYHRDR